MQQLEYGPPFSAKLPHQPEVLTWEHSSPQEKEMGESGGGHLGNGGQVADSHTEATKRYFDRFVKPRVVASARNGTMHIWIGSQM